MPIHSCTLPDGRSGFKWGDSGKCYPTREQAEAQARAAYANGYTGKADLLGRLRKPEPRPAPLAALLKANLDQAAHQAATSVFNLKKPPTEAQAKAGNYPKGHWSLKGLKFTIENPEHSHRRPEWPPLSAHYGYIRGTVGADGDQVDAFLRPATDEHWDGPVFVIDQNDEQGEFDELKVMIGWDNERTAVHDYLKNYPHGWKVGEVTELTLDQLRQFLSTGGGAEPLKGQLPANEHIANCAPGHAHAAANQLPRQALLSKLDRKIQVPLGPGHQVVALMLALRENLQVSKVVVQPVTVAMVDNFLARKRSADGSFHDQAMLKSLSSDPADYDADETVRRLVAWKVADVPASRGAPHELHRVAELAVSITDDSSKSVSKGDVPGHEFHGNQWTGGEESGKGDPPAPGQKFTVYRVGTEPSLAMRNAGNAQGVADFLAHADDPFGPTVAAKGTNLMAFEVSVDQPFGEYATLNHGRGSAKAPGRWSDQRGGVKYSFPETGFSHRLIASVPMSQVRDAMKARGFADFDESGSIAGAQVLRDMIKPRATKADLIARLGKEWTQSASATSGITSYGRTRARREKLKRIKRSLPNSPAQ
jgi:hypothetical protein